MFCLRAWQCILIVVAISFTFHSANAAPTANPTLLSETDFFADIPVVLSATRLQQPVNEAPVATSIIDREMIDASGFTEIPDLLRLVPGFYVSYDSGHIMAVGYHLLHDRYVRHQQVLIDGRSVYSPLLGGVNWSEIPIVMDDIDRIEVIRGPNASTFGSNSFLGVINIITRHASQDRGNYIKVNAGTNNYRNGVYRHGSNVGNLDYRITVNYRQDDGFAKRFDGKKVNVITVRGDYLFDNNDNLSFKLGYSGGPREEDNAISSSVPNHIKETSGQFQQLTWQHTQSEDSEYQLQIYHNFNHDEQNYPGINYKNKTDRLEIEFQHQLKASDDLRLVWGASNRTDKVSGPLWVGTDSFIKNRIKRLFVNGEYQLDKATLINAGVLHEDNGTADKTLSPRLSINHQLNTKNSLRLTVSKATRAPVIFEEDPYYGGAFSGIVDLEPEHITTYELGYLTSNINNSISLDAKIFYDRIRGLIQYDQVGAQYIFYNLDDAWIRGLETSLTLRPSKNTRVIANYSHTKIKSTRNSVNSEYDIAFPKNLLSLLVIHDFSDAYKGSLGFYHRSATKGLARRASDPRTLDAYKRIDLRLAKKMKLFGSNSEISLTIQNFFDEVPYSRLMNYPKRQAYLSWQTNFN